MTETKTVNFGKTVTQMASIHIYEMANYPAVRLMIEFDGVAQSWVEFETAEKAWGLVDSLTKHVQNAFGDAA